ncbi:hypothetical protein MLD38_002896 [Melastoma candidum]|uniref:Uncharacterized protein n=1 Tax=Melastoma candidum TaxID=119954 RepID=A0ACB9S0H4_9MYRT|nr:hypothetical protein MLD38_002896 [Melastoma candidum]
MSTSADPSPSPNPRPPPAFLSLLPNPKTTLSSKLLLPLHRYSSDSPPTQQHPRSDSMGGPRQAPVESSPGFPSTMRISAAKDGGPAFVGQVFSMCDLSGTGLMAVSTHFDVPFITKRTPEWLKKMFASITKSERKGPVFRFFLDLGDAVTYVKRLNIPSGVVGACRLDLAYEHFKEKPHMFQFVPNEKQVKMANKLLKTFSQSGGNRKVDGVPVFSAENLDIAIATTEGIKWYTPYFFDKDMLDNILEESIDQHFHSMIQTRHMMRRREVGDDSLGGVIEDLGDTMWEPPEVQEVLEEVGHPAIPLSIISKAAEMQLLYAVDRLILGNRWLRKATGIQPKFPYLVDTFERRSAASFHRASKSRMCPDLMAAKTDEPLPESMHKLALDGNDGDLQGQKEGSSWLEQQHESSRESNTGSEISPPEHITSKPLPNPFLPKITMVGISTGEAGPLSKASLKKTMDDLTKELEQNDHGSSSTDIGSSYNEERDPLFVANVGDYYSSLSKTGSSRFVRSRGELNQPKKPQ